MQSIYMDNASTAFPKAPGVAKAVAGYLTGVGMNVARGGYSAAHAAEQEMLDLRLTLCRLFGSGYPEGCILTPGATYGMNMALKGFLRHGDHVIVSGMEHNAVMRPLRQLEGLRIDVIPSRADGGVDPDSLSGLICPDTRLVCVTAVSNVCGTVMPVKALGEICRRHGISFVVDASQGVGYIPMDMEDMNIDALIFSAHKGLLGPQGIGAALLSKDFAKALKPFVTGGTGSHSELEHQPAYLPDKLEAGTPNLPGIYGFLAALRYWEKHFSEIAVHEKKLLAQFLDGLSSIDGIRLLGLPTLHGRTGILALDFLGKDNGEIAALLEENYGILTRSGLHCAPAAHRTLGSYAQGAVRFSLGWQTTGAEVALTLDAIRHLAADSL